MIEEGRHAVMGICWQTVPAATIAQEAEAE